jgi:phosphoenolpyruvate-protein phosphotransferase/dihydroxyacetone kinase phosphotransfer subunit
LVGILVVAHGEQLAKGVVQVARQMTAGKDVPIAAAGGLEDGTLGTSLDRIQQGLDAVYSDAGVLILMDLGSAVMTTEMLLEMLPPEQRAVIRMSNAPLVEGAIAAAVAAAQGGGLDEVQHAAETAMDLPKLPDLEMAAAPEVEVAEAPAGPVETIDLVVPNPVGLHARPAVKFVETALRFDAHITVQNATRGGPAVDAKSMMQVSNQATARQGETIRIVARGQDASAALAALRELVDDGFGEMEASVVAVPRPAAKPATARLSVPEGPPPPRLHGIAVSEGYVVAPAFVHRRVDRDVPRRTVDDSQAELQRFHDAREAALQQLEQIQERVSAAADTQTAQIFEFHRMMLQDAEVVGAVEEQIGARKLNAEAAVNDVFSEWVDRFAGLEDDLMRARAADVRDVGDRVLGLLMDAGASALAELPGEVIVVADDLVPSETALLDRDKVRGLATAVGGETSHTAILARMLGIPAVVGLGAGILAVPSGTKLALDGESGVVEVNPAPEVVEQYEAREARLQAVQDEALKTADQPAITRDGRQVEVAANIGDVQSAEEAVRYGAEGVGLLRSEFLYLDRTELPDEEEQFEAYRAIAEVMGQRPLIVRTLDVGGDKQLPYLEIGPELNPFLGVRAIRLSLERPDIFQPQLRAILRAGAGHNIKIMFPMVATRKETAQARSALAQAREALAQQGIPHAGQVEVGIMVETPASAIMSPLLAQDVDFFSIGSNDLTQYTLAVDRGNERLSNLYRALDPAVLHLIRMVIEAAHAAGKWVGLCGELAGQRSAIPILLGLGLDEFSMTPRAIPLAKRLIRRLHAGEMEALADEVLTLATADEVEQYMARFLSEMGEE